MSEFYCVCIDDGTMYFFKDKDNARNFLWQAYLDNCSGYETDEDLAKAKMQLNMIDMITGIGVLAVSGFED